VDNVHLSTGTTVLGLRGTLPRSVLEAYKNDPFVIIRKELAAGSKGFDLKLLPEKLRVQEGLLFAKSVVALRKAWHDPRIKKLRTTGAEAVLALGKLAAPSGMDAQAPAISPLPPASAHGLFELLGCPDLTIRSNGDVTPCCYDTSSTVALGNLLTTPMREILSPGNVARVARRIVDDQEERRRTRKSVECDRCPRFRHSRFCRKSVADLLLRE
jgi:hypothetical protein